MRKKVEPRKEEKLKGENMRNESNERKGDGRFIVVSGLICLKRWDQNASS
jgi:hypothetical protein